MNDVLGIFKKYLFAHLFFLALMSFFRLYFFIYYNPNESFDGLYLDIFNAFLLGFRIDLTVIGYIQAIPTILLIILYFINKRTFFHWFSKVSIVYLFLCYFIVTILLCADFGFYSYFKDHINILFFGFIDDDTSALLITFWQNYNVILILTLFVVYLVCLLYVISFIFKQKYLSTSKWLNKAPIITLVVIVIFNFLAIRGTLGMYPLGKMIPTVSTNKYVNSMSQNGVRAFVSAYDVRKKFLKRKYDLIKSTGFKGNIEEAFRIYKGTESIDTNNLLNNITYTTKGSVIKDYNVIVIMVESFGMPILKYNSQNFNIMGSLAHHFEEDIVFDNFISAGNGTISSLEALLLNIPHRPSSFPFSQSTYKQTSFYHTPGFIYQSAGYETSFIYGGDLSWRDLGNFVKYQGFNKVEGKIDIYNALDNKEKHETEYFHPWGIFDEYLYSHLMTKLEKSTKKQFIFALSTNNHPPYNLPKDYKKLPLDMNEEIKSHITGGLELAQERFSSFQYAVNSVGNFLSKFKKTKFAKDTIVVITADNNTIDGIMKYDEKALFLSKNIPLYLYLPQELKDKLDIDTSVAGSHKDIFPTLYEMTLKNKNYISIGHNLLDKTSKKIGFNGARVVHTKNKSLQVQNINKRSKDGDSNYYRASLAITQYLLNNNERKK